MSSLSHAPLSSLLAPAAQETTHSLLALEKTIQQVGEDLLEVYSQRKQWLAVKQLAQTLADNSERIQSLSELLPGVVDQEETEEAEERVVDLGELLLEMSTSARAASSVRVTVEEGETGDGDACFHIIATIPGAGPVTRSQADVAVLHINLLEKYYQTALALHKSLPVTVGELQRFLSTALSEPSIQNDAALVTFLTKGGSAPMANGSQRTASLGSSGMVESDLSVSSTPSPVHQSAIISPLPPAITVPALPSATSPVLPSNTSPVPPSTTSPVPPSTTSPVLPSTPSPVPPSTTSPVLPSTPSPVLPSTPSPVLPSTPSPVLPSTTSPLPPLTTDSFTHHSPTSPVSSIENSLLGVVRPEGESDGNSDRPLSPSGSSSEVGGVAQPTLSNVPTSTDPSVEESNPLSCDTSSSSLPTSSIAPSASASGVENGQVEVSPDHVTSSEQVLSSCTDESASTSAVSLDTDEMDNSRRAIQNVPAESLLSSDLVNSSSSHEQDRLLSPLSEPSTAGRESSPSSHSESSQLTDKSDGTPVHSLPPLFLHSSQSPVVSTSTATSSESDIALATSSSTGKSATAANQLRSISDISPRKKAGSGDLDLLDRDTFDQVTSTVLAPISENSDALSTNAVKHRSARRSPSAKLSSSIKMPKLGRSKTVRDDAVEHGVESTVSLAARQLTTEWDPTCILEELYNDCRPVVHSSGAGENCRHSGYLDKLPVNQKKPNVMKGWKTRFFRLTRGSLFYYDDENATKATSFIRLADAKIVVDSDSLKIQIYEKGSGNLIILRAENKDDLATWQKCLQLEAVHPTMTHRLSLSPTHQVPTLIVDLGSCSVRAGIASDNTYPQLFFPTVCAVDVDSLQVVATGLKALSPEIRSQTRLVYPLRTRVRMDTLESQRLLCLQGIIDSVLADLHIQPRSSNILVSISPAMPDNDREDLARLLLEDFGFHGIMLEEQTILALYSYNCTTGIVVNTGDTVDVVPIIDGFKVESGSSHLPLCGSAVTENLSKLASAKDIRYFSGTETFIIRFVKESICFLSQNYGHDLEKCDESPATYARAVDVDRFQLPDHKKVVHLDSALFKAPEGLFCPGLWGKDIPAVHELVFKAIEQSPIDMRKDLCRSIYLAGGTSLLVGFPERLELELLQLMPRADIQVQASDTRQHAAYLGAATLASLSSFSKSLVTIEDWNADGMNALKRKI